MSTPAAPGNVGVVIVSHSPHVARGAQDMVRQMVGESVPLAACGGNPDGGLGTDVAAIATAIDAAWSERGVAVLVDLGGAEMNAEMAIEMLEESRRGLVAICSAAIVEGAVMAATEASIGSGLAESLRGFEAACGDVVRLHHDPVFLTRVAPAPEGKVALVSGGGSGHEPLHGGFVGLGMLDAACPGQVFTSPTPDQMLAAAQAVDRGAGTLFIVKNYSGDVMNFEMAVEMYEGTAATVLTNDDVAVEDSTYTTGRRGVAGTLVVEKIVGAAAESGADLESCRALGARVNERTASMGVALTSCTVPEAGRPTFDIDDDRMEMGVGIHGEPGRKRLPMASADEIAAKLMEPILSDLSPDGGERALLLVNGFGATPLMELTLMYDAARRAMSSSGIEVVRSLVGNYVTSLDMAGCSITLSLMDDEALSLWDAPVHTAALRWGC